MQVRISAYSLSFLFGRLGALVSVVEELFNLVALRQGLRWLPPAVMAVALASFGALFLSLTDKGFDELVAKPTIRKRKTRGKTPPTDPSMGRTEGEER